jgi:hypothetical protein
MSRIEPMQEEAAHISSFDLIQKKMIEAVFQSYEYYCLKDETRTSFTHSTKFFRSVPMVYAMLYRYMPKEMKIAIKQAFDKIDAENKQIDGDKTLSDENKRLTKCKLEDEYGGQILQLCILALQYSPVNTELKEIIMTSDKVDFNDIMRKIRSDKPAGIFREVGQDGL